MFPVGLICIALAYKLSFFALIETIRQNYLLTAFSKKRPVGSEENRCRALPGYAPMLVFENGHFFIVASTANPSGDRIRAWREAVGGAVVVRQFDRGS